MHSPAKKNQRANSKHLLFYLLFRNPKFERTDF